MALPSNLKIVGHATFDKLNPLQYRYRLLRWWSWGPKATFVMLNPSIADAELNDHTIVKCMNFAYGWGYSGIRVVNLYALRSTDPKNLWKVDQPIGRFNDRYLVEAARSAEYEDAPLIAAWGNNAQPARVRQVMKLVPAMKRMQCFGVTGKGMPMHPLRLSYSTKLQPWGDR